MQLATPSSRPTFTTQTNIYYNIGDKILLRAEGYTMNQRQVLIAQNNEQQSIDGWVDLNTGIEYRYNKNTSLFLNINNLTNNKYQRWYALPVYGINVLGGITLTF
jgi:outer membrane autotransporter protein